MKVLHVLNEIKPSGAEVMLHDAAAYWKAHGVEAHVLGTGREIGVYADRLRGAGYVLHHLPYGRRPDFFWRYAQLIRRERYDIVHQHVEGSGFWFSLAARAAGSRVVRVVHNNFRFEGSLKLRRRLQRRLLERLGVRFVAIAEGVRRNEAERFGVNPVVIWNWADVERFRPPTAVQREQARERFGFAADDIVLVSVGNCSKVKNHDALIRALADLKLDNVKYLHVGVEDAESSERALAQRLGVERRVVFTGWLADAREALHAADLYVMPSLYEGLGNATIEALSTGLPALLADVPGLQDFAPLFPGLIYCRPESTALAEALTRFAALDPAARRGLSIAYPDIAHRSFSPERGAREFSTLYRTLAPHVPT